MSKFSHQRFKNNCLTHFLTFVTSIFFCFGQQNFTNFQSANLVVGQQNFYTNNNFCSQNTLNGPSYVAVSSKGVLAIAQQTGGGVRLWNTMYDSNGKNADIVVGKSSFTNCNWGSPTQTNTNDINGVAFSPDGNKLIVSDSRNNRVLIWNSIPTTNGQPADIVIGQNNFTSASSGVSNSLLNYPTGIFVSPNGKLFISDRNNNRILIWNSIPTTNGKSADIVIGQQNFLTNTSGNSASKLNRPWGLWVSFDGKLLVADEQNHRVLIWNSIPITNGAAADVVVGQNNFNISSSGTTSNKFNIPVGVTVSPDGKLAVGEFGNRRVLIFNTIPENNGASANTVLGQPNFTSNLFYSPTGLVNDNNFTGVYNTCFDLYGRLFVSGRDMNRTLIFGDIPDEQIDLNINLTTDFLDTCVGTINTLSVNVTNNSSITATGVIASATFPSNFTYASHNGDGLYNNNSGYWNIGSIPPNSTKTLTIYGYASSIGISWASSNILQTNQLDTNLLNNGASLQLIVNTNNASPLTLAPQNLCYGSVVGQLMPNNNNIRWYENSSGGIPLDNDTLLEKGRTYYATQIINGCESSRTPIIPLPIKIWNGTNWSGNGLPPSNNDHIIFESNYISTQNIKGCSCEILNGNITFSSNTVLELVNELQVFNNSTIVFENNASLYQKNNVTNYGSIIYNKYTSNIYNNYDFVYLGSPVINESLQNIWMSNTNSTFYEFNTINNNWNSLPGFTPLNAGKGYIARALHGSNGWSIGSFWSLSFNGVPNNGEINIPIYTNTNNSYNLISNPYPCAIDIERLYEDNSNLIYPNFYFWTHNTPISSNNYNQNDYAVYNAILGIGVGTGSNAITGGNIPSSIVSSCQGFFVEGLENGILHFNNNQRLPHNNAFFFKNHNQQDDKHCIWLNLSDDTGKLKQIALANHTLANNNSNPLLDVKTISNNPEFNFYSLRSNQNLMIQTNSLPIDIEQIIPLGYSLNTNSELTISIYNFIGLYDNHNVFLKDNYLNNIHNLKNNPYTFFSNSGTFNDRFEIILVPNFLENLSFESLTINIFPNPADNEVFFSNIDLNEKIQYKLTDGNGRLLESKTLEANKINLNNLSSGIYYLTFYYKNKLINHKLIKL